MHAGPLTGCSHAALALLRVASRRVACQATAWHSAPKRMCPPRRTGGASRGLPGLAIYSAFGHVRRGQRHAERLKPIQAAHSDGAQACSVGSVACCMVHRVRCLLRIACCGRTACCPFQITRWCMLHVSYGSAWCMLEWCTLHSLFFVLPALRCTLRSLRCTSHIARRMLHAMLGCCRTHHHGRSMRHCVAL
jgi:hypothetical protein